MRQHKPIAQAAAMRVAVLPATALQALLKGECLSPMSAGGATKETMSHHVPAVRQHARSQQPVG